MSGGLTVTLAFLLHLVLQAGFTVRAIMRPDREPTARMAWVVVIFAIPIIGMATYVLFGETNIGRKRVERARAAQARLEPIQRLWRHSVPAAAHVPVRYGMLFSAGRAVSGFPPVGGNTARVLADGDATIAAMVADIDAARDHAHVLFYIWLTDASGRAVAEALMRAARRGVTCRAIADDIGSRQLIRSTLWTEMTAAGVHTCRALPVGNPVMRMIEGRLDMRNHRKIVVIDNHITYCGSQNCADAAFAIKAKFAPWIDIMVRFKGPIALQNQLLFALDWMSHVDEDLHGLFSDPPPLSEAGVMAQVVASDPASRYSAMPEMFESLMYAARSELVITTPYYVPDESIQAALCACARRGVPTTLVLPARNDSLIVAAASRSYYKQLLDAGVCIHEYEGGLLHAKTLTLDGEIVFIGSANIDRRSFDLNSENNMLAFDAGLAGAVRDRQRAWIATSRQITRDTVSGWSGRRNLWNNTVAMVGPLL